MSRERFGTSIRVVTALLLALTLSGVSLLPSPALAATYQLSGKVTDQSSNPIVGATVAVIDPSTSATVASTTTDSSGTYSLSVDGGTYNIQVTPPSGSGFGSSITLDQGDQWRHDTQLYPGSLKLDHPKWAGARRVGKWGAEPDGPNSGAE